MSIDQNGPHQWAVPVQPQPAPGYVEHQNYQSPTPAKGHAKAIIAAVVAVLVVGATVAGVAIALVSRSSDGPRELSAKQYVDQLCVKTGSVIKNLPPSGSISDSGDSGGSEIDATLDNIVKTTKFLSGVGKLVAVEQDFAETNAYAGVGGKELKRVIATGSLPMQRALRKAVDILGKMSNRFEEFLKIEDPTIDDRTELESYIAEQKAAMSSLLPDQQELPGDSTVLFTAAQMANDAIDGDLKDALTSIDAAAQLSDACQSTLDYEM